MSGNESKYQEILDSKAKKICVIAGPGSGKTKGVLVPKALQLMRKREIDPDEVLIISFSRLSAQDLRQKVKEFDRVPRASTLHSICLSFLLSENNHGIKKRIESIAIDFEKQVIISDLKISFPERKKYDLKRMLEEFSTGWETKPHDQVFIEDDIKKSFMAAVVNWLDEHEAAMMEEIVYHAVDLAKKLKTKFVDKPQYILVDEFQDLNRLEQEFVTLLGANSKLVLVVGDPDQSIYSFKYAHPEGIVSLAESEGVEKHSLAYSGRCAKKILKIANQLLCQSNPTRIEFLMPLSNAVEGEVSLVEQNLQDDEFNFVLNAILKQINEGIEAKEIIVLVPRKKLGTEFVEYAKNHQLPEGLSFKFVVKNDYTHVEQEKILLLGVLANPNSVFRVRTFTGLKDKNHFSTEFLKLKIKYGNLREAIQKANPDDFSKRNKKLRALCIYIHELKQFIDRYEGSSDLDKILDEIFPSKLQELENLRNIFMELKEEGDTIQILFSKFIDHSRTLETKGNVIRVMTLLASKGLDAEHVFIMACNDGNIPGKNRSSSLSNHDYKQEQRRLLFVGVTRAKKSLTVSWSRNIPFRQSRNHYTQSVRTITKNGKRYSQVGLSEFLQDINWN